jgi:hypothetical protein
MKYAGYIILAKNQEGEIFGYVEHSFSMGFDKSRVRVDRIWEHRPYGTSEAIKLKLNGMSLRQYAWVAMCKQVKKITKLHKGIYEFKAFRIGCKSCPVTINWNEVRKMRLSKNIDKFKWRNLPFKLKENFIWK